MGTQIAFLLRFIIARTIDDRSARTIPYLIAFLHERADACSSDHFVECPDLEAPGFAGEVGAREGRDGTRAPRIPQWARPFLWQLLDLGDPIVWSRLLQLHQKLTLLNWKLSH